jgi:DNA-directed RNA polymerase subunit omega
VALREIAEETVEVGDLKEDLVHSMQKLVEVDEPEPDLVPMLTVESATQGEDDGEVVLDRMTEEDLLRGLEGLPPLEPSDSGAGGGY